MIGKIRSTRLGILLNAGIGITFIVAAVIVVISVNYGMRQEALNEAQLKARIILDRNFATHTYFSQIMKPSILSWSEPFRSKDYFDHTWMSSTYAIREIEKYFKTFNPSGYYFKDAAINARSPENEADEYERAFLEKLGADKNLDSESTVRKIDGKPYLVVLRRSEAMEASCLRCHSNPKDAPKGLTDYYGSERSFNRKEGDVASAVSFHIPLSEAYAAANIFSMKLSAILLSVLLCLFMIQYLFYRRYLLKPLDVIQEKAIQIATHEEHLGEQIILPFGRELNELAVAFNEMSVKLRHDRDHLEELVDQRTEALRESETRYRELFDNMSSGVAIYEVTNNGNNFIFKDFNRAGERLDGDRKEDIIGKSIYEVRPGIKEYGILEVFKRVWATGIPEHYPDKFYQDERLQGWYDNFVYRLPSGEIVAVYDDITERKQAEEALRKSEALLREAQAAAHIGHWELDTSIMRPRWSEEIFHIFGLDPEKGEPSFAMHQEITHPDDWNILNNAVTTSIAEGTPFDIEFRVLRPDKTIRWMHAIGYPKRDSEGRMESVFGTAQDITERKQAEDEKYRMEERSRKVVEDIFRFIPEGVLVFSRKMELLRQNQAFQELVSGYARRLGFTEDELENLIVDKIKAAMGDKNIKEIRISRKHETGEQT